ncbi:MAG: glycosyltransferase family 39 protein [Chitinophagaceae bacterium]
MKVILQKNHRLVFYGMWLLLGLMQAGLTELQDDEAYYWVFSKYLSLGYFDHPPMTALLVKTGCAIFPNELGVRLFPLLLSVLSLFIIEKLTVKKNPFLFYSIALSLAILQVSGFNAVPDTPLVFFTALFFLFYKKFTEKQSWRNIFLLSLSVALLFYTKYHAVLIVLFTLFSNLRLLTTYKTYIAGLIALLLFLPHLAWQWEHNWVSFRYHLFESNVNAYQFSFTTDYLLGQLILAGPIAGFILLPAAFSYKTTNATEKAMRYTMAGIYIFFFLSSFRGKVEANWTSPAIVSLIVLSHQQLLEKLRWQRLLFRLLPVTLILVLFARVVMIEDILPVKEIRQRYHSWKEWPAIMKERTKGLPVVFSNSYQRASKYWFYSGQVTLSQNLYKERRNNYNFWPIENEMIGKPVYFLDIYDLKNFPDSLKTPIGYVGYRYDSSFLSFGTVNIPLNAKHRIHSGDSLRVYYGGIPMPGTTQLSYLAKYPQSQYGVHLVFFQGKTIISEVPVSIDMNEMTRKTYRYYFTLTPALPKGRYQMMLSFAVPGYNPTHNSEKIKVVVD